DEYHWKDGIGPRENRKRIVNTNWGAAVENNHFGTHEFFHLLDLLGADSYINGNVGSGTVQEMQEWIEYMTFPGESPMANLRKENGRENPWDVAFFGIGNENWGVVDICVQNTMQTYIDTTKHMLKIITTILFTKLLVDQILMTIIGQNN